MKLSLIKTGAAALIASAVLVACGGGGGGGDQLADNLVVNLNATTAPILFDNGPMLFPNGIPGVGNSGAATLELTQGPTPGTTAFKVIETTGDQRTIQGSLVYGSCTFTVATPVSLAGTVFIRSCSIRITATGVTPGGGFTSTSANLNLNDPTQGTSNSNPFNENISRNGSNQITFKLEPTGTVGPLQSNPLTGAYN